MVKLPDYHIEIAGKNEEPLSTLSNVSKGGTEGESGTVLSQAAYLNTCKMHVPASFLTLGITVWGNINPKI